MKAPTHEAVPDQVFTFKLPAQPGAKGFQMERVEARIRAAEAALCQAMYVDTLTEALDLIKLLRHEVHVVATVAGLRAELDFLCRRKEALTTPEVSSG